MVYKPQSIVYKIDYSVLRTPLSSLILFNIRAFISTLKSKFIIGYLWS